MNNFGRSFAPRGQELFITNYESDAIKAQVCSKMKTKSYTGREVWKMLKQGDAAPEFEVRDADGETVRLADFRGQRVALYFYPKDDTPG